jgi:hypothetical protein
MAICKRCRSTCRVVSHDFGAGPYVRGSERSVHQDLRQVTSCCRSEEYWATADHFAGALADALEAGGIAAERLAAIWLLLPEGSRP